MKIETNLIKLKSFQPGLFLLRGEIALILSHFESLQAAVGFSQMILCDRDTLPDILQGRFQRRPEMITALEITG